MSSNATATENTTTPADFCNPANMPQPTREHEWLQKFVGDWETEAEMFMEPGKPPMKSQGSNRDRMLGGFWLISEGGSDSMPFQFRLTLGYDPKKKKYVGTWTDSMTSYLWKYEGTVNPAGDILTLETEGPNPHAPDKTAKYREVTEFKSKDHRVFTSSCLGEDGKWNTFVTVTARRRK
jgi:hypothetical protein